MVVAQYIFLPSSITITCLDRSWRAGGHFLGSWRAVSAVGSTAMNVVLSQGCMTGRERPLSEGSEPGLHMMQRRTVHQAKCMRAASHLHLDAWYLSGIVSAFASRCSGARWHQIHRQCITARQQIPSTIVELARFYK